MASESKDLSAMVDELRSTYASGTTRSRDWRVSQLKSLERLVDLHELEIIEALRSDLSKPEMESYVHEAVLMPLFLVTKGFVLLLFGLSFCSTTVHSSEPYRACRSHHLVSLISPYAKSLSTRLEDITKDNLSRISMLKSSCKVTLKGLKRWMAPEKAKTSMTTFPSSAEIVSEPLGVVLIISAWNYPFLLSLDPVIGAIAAGNAVVLKPSEVSPVSSSLLAKLVEKYLDKSAIRVVEGAVAETSALLEQKWDKICYTGNSRVGRIVMQAAAKHLTPVLLELGGKSPVVVDSDINLKVASRRIIAGKWACNNGQACIAPDYIITTKGFAPKLIDALKQELEKFYGKTPLESKDLSRIVNANHYSRLVKFLDEEKVSGKIVIGGERNEKELKISPTILLDVPRDSLIMSEEIFGPLLPIITVDKLEESFDIIQSGSKPLAAYLFTSNDKLKKQFVSCVSAGGVVVNDTTIHLAVPTLPFGGVGESGMGAYHGKFSFDAFSHKKAVVYRGFVGDAAVRYPPYTKGKLRLLKALIGGSFMGIIKALFGWS